MPAFETRSAECRFYVKEYLTQTQGDHTVKECADYVRAHASSPDVAGTGVMAGVMRTLVTSESAHFITTARGRYRYVASPQEAESAPAPLTLGEQGAQALEQARAALGRICTVNATELDDAELETLRQLVALSRELGMKAAQLRGDSACEQQN